MKKNELDTIINLISLNFTKKQIRKKLNISKTNLANRLYTLEKMGIIRRIGKYEIELIDDYTSSQKHPRVTKIPIHKKLNKRGHAFNFRIIFPSEKDLRNNPLVKQFMSLSKNFKILNFGSISFKYKRNTIWINKNSLTIYSNNSYFSSDALHSKFYALKDISALVSYLKQRFGFVGVYGIEVFREHYGLIYNKFAEWLLERGSKLEVKNKGNKSIYWVDDSRKDDIGLKEFEGSTPQKINRADLYFKSHDETNWKVTPSFTLKAFNEVTKLFKDFTKIQLMNSNNIIKHQKVLDDMLSTMKSIRDGLKDLKRK